MARNQHPQPPACRDPHCPVPACQWYKIGYGDGFADGYAAASTS